MYFDFAPPRAFNFDQKHSRKFAQIIPYYHLTKLELIGHVLSISEYVLEKHELLPILVKKLGQSVAQVTT